MDCETSQLVSFTRPSIIPPFVQCLRRSEGFARAAYFVPGCDGIGVWPNSEIVPSASAPASSAPQGMWSKACGLQINIPAAGAVDREFSIYVFEILKFSDFEILRYSDFEIFSFPYFEIFRFYGFQIFRFSDLYFIFSYFQI